MSRHQDESSHNESRISEEPSSEHLDVLSLTVLFTTVSGTLDALREASQLARQLQARIEILVAWVVPYPLPIDRPGTDPRFRLREVSTFCEQESIEARIEIRLCRDVRHCLLDALRPRSLILMGGGHSWWPLTFERRLARELKSAGHQIIFVGQRQQRWIVQDVSRVNSHANYNRARLVVIVSVMAMNSSCAVFSTVHHQYPLGVAPILFLIPGLARELDLRNGRKLKRLGPFEWSCFIAGFLFLVVLPAFMF